MRRASLDRARSIDYLLRYSDDGGVTWTTQDLHSTSTSTTLDLADGASDLFEVAAVNHSGQGGWSVLASPPAAPTLTGITAGNEYVSVQFVAGVNGGSPITGYQYSLDGGMTWHANGVASPMLIPGLVNGTSYTVELRAVNAAGTSSVSNSRPRRPSRFLRRPTRPRSSRRRTMDRSASPGPARTAMVHRCRSTRSLSMTRPSVVIKS